MTKQFFLMNNLIEKYWNKVELDIWLKLDNDITTKADECNNFY